MCKMEYSRARFCEALSQENVKGFLSVLENMNAQVNTPDAQGQTMLWHYVKARDYKKVEFLIRCDADPSVADHAGFTPVHVALMQGQAIDEIIARMLLASRPTSSISDILKGGLSLDELLLDHSDNRDTHDGVDVLKLLLELGADVNIVNSERETPLMRAAHLGDLKAIKILLKQENINLYNKDRYGQTALHIATREGQLGAVNELLSSQRLDVNCKNSHGSSAFWLSVYLGREHISERFLNDSRVDVNAMGGGTIHRWQTTALYTACLHGKSQMVSRILAARRFPEVDPNIQGDGRKSPLGAAAYQNAYEVVELLLKADGIRINAKDGREDDPFWLAIGRRAMSVAPLFLDDSRLDINCQNNQKGDTYLIAAARDGNFRLISKLLMSKGIDLERKNREGKTALEIARQLSRHDIVQQIESSISGR